MPTVTLLTPTYRGDLERFTLQRESIERCGITLPHIAVVQDEDLALFQAVPYRQNLTLLSTKDVLPPQIERRRAAYHLRRRNPKRWLVRHPLHGWYTQQLVKLAVDHVIGTDGWVCLDSDVFFVRKVEAEDFFEPDGKMHLYDSQDNLDAEMAGWLSKSMSFLGVKATGKPLSQFVHQVVPIRRQVIQEMHAYIQERHKKPWAGAMAEADVYEYSTYGVFARYVHQMKLLTAVEPSLCLYYWWAEQAATLESDMLARLAESHAKAVLIQSNLGCPVSVYRPMVEQAWRSLAGEAA